MTHLSVLEDTEQEFESDNEVGPPINDQLANVLKTMTKSKMDENKTPPPNVKNTIDQAVLNNRLYQKLSRKFGEFWHHNTKSADLKLQGKKANITDQGCPCTGLWHIHVSESQEMKNLVKIVCRLETAKKESKNADQGCQWTMHWHIHVIHVLGANHKR